MRTATDADGPSIGRLIADVFAEYGGCAFAIHEFPELKGVASHFAARGGTIWAVEQAGRVAGTLAVARSAAEPDAFELFKVYLALDLRGRGIAAGLLERAIDFAKARGAASLVLWTDTRFLDGHRFYERHGFRREPGIRALHDVSVSLEYRYRLDLTR